MSKRILALYATTLLMSFGQASWAQTTVGEYTTADGEVLRIARGAEALGGPVVGIPNDIDIRDLPAVAPWKPGDPIVEIPKRDDGTGITPDNITAKLDPLVNTQREFRGPEPAFTEMLNFDGDNSTANPNDPTGDIGPNYYIESFNGCGGSCVAIFDKTTGDQVGSTFSMDDLAVSGDCQSGAGDPIILYDEIADRWLLTEFTAIGDNDLCLYTSRTSDPVSGGWCAYEFQDNDFPDYPKFAVWPDQYVVSSQQGAAVPVYAFDRQNMLSQDGATCPTARAPQKLSNVVPDLAGLGFELLIPVDHDGAGLPPEGEPGIFIRQVDEEMHGLPSNPGSDPVEMWVLDPDFDNEANTTLTQLPDIVLSEFDSLLCPPVSFFSCVPQPDGGQALDPLLEVIMNKPTYRNFGTYEAIVGVFQVDIGDFEDHSGVRWFEFRRTLTSRGGTGNWELYQEGTYSPDTEHRFMGMINMDQSGNILLGYNVSSTSVYPSIRYTGRLVGDPLGVMTISEQELATGGGVNSSIRYGDYNQIGVDPVDSCTFWMLGMYNPSGKAIRIGSGRFESCDVPDLDYNDGFESSE